MIGHEALGHQHPELAPIVNTLWLAGHGRDDSAEAVRLLVSTTAWLERAVAPQHPALLACRATLPRTVTRGEPPGRAGHAGADAEVLGR
jgi:hypothetical protein